MSDSKTIKTEQKPTDSINIISSQEFVARSINQSLLAQIVTSLQSNQRHSKANVKTRGQVAGSTKKPWRQKGTGRARVGTRMNPIWRGGGIAFGPTKERNFYKKINQKDRQAALMFALSRKAENQELLDIKKLPEFGKTKEVAAFLKDSLGFKNNLIVSVKLDDGFVKLAKNIKNIKTILVNNLGLLDVIKARNIIFLPETLATLKNKKTLNKNE